MRFRLSPTDRGFFPLFCQAAENAAACSHRLRELLDQPHDGSPPTAVMACESEGDRLTREILHRLNSTFVTPFDREDIHALTEELDDVVDDMLDVAELLQLLSVGDVPAELKAQADLLVSMAEETVVLVGKLESMRDTREHLDTIDRLESEGDAVFRRALARLFSGDYSALEVLKWKDIIEAMERALNTIEDISTIVEAIVLKHA